MEHIFNTWPNLAEMASDLGKPYPTVAAWKLRGRIPSDHDFSIIEAAKKRGKTITLEDLAFARATKNNQEAAQ